MSKEDLMRQSMDCVAWYELTYQRSILSINLSPPAIEALKKMSRVPYIAALQKEFELPDFILPSEKIWGFGPLLQWSKPEKSGWTTISCKLPVIIKPQLNRGLPLSATLNILFTWLMAFEKDWVPGKKRRKQLVIVECFNTGIGFYGCSLSIRLTPQFCSWIQRLCSRDLERVKSAMANAYYTVYPASKKIFSIRGRDFKAWCRYPGLIHLEVPGNACSLDPDGYELERTIGYRLVPHNTDTSVQQITLLAGVAKLNQLAREAGF